MADFCGFAEYSGSLSRRAISGLAVASDLANRHFGPTETRRAPHLLANQNGPASDANRQRGLAQNSMEVLHG